MTEPHHVSPLPLAVSFATKSISHPVSVLRVRSVNRHHVAYPSASAGLAALNQDTVNQPNCPGPKLSIRNVTTLLLAQWCW